MSLHDPGVTIFNMHDRTEATLTKFNFWNKYLQMNQYDCFNSFTSILSENEIHLNENIERNINEHFQLTFTQNVPNKLERNNWMRNPFQAYIINNTSLSFF